ncbi:oxidoreductase family protein [Rubellicoccus peritrichatus]|uniref:Oxidoreductase family protein n=1 Tax=Rubellicoccus peritrichatus TaxID=3080537 RepID=A0AAQ3L852_9BACT|nr:oxidoreductase family protein [Puniceicoccus sp. CR14]WOO40836.1 oxidoreductase family protein [Puniceicoccus sp. CR14]
MKLSVPERIEEITPEWITAMLKANGHLTDASVVNTNATKLGQDMGFLSCVAKFDLTYDMDETTAPKSIVVKIRPLDEQLLEIGEAMNAFEREIRFYQEVAPKVDARLPKFYATSGSGPEYALIMEDLSFCRAGDQVEGMPHEMVAKTAKLMAKIQARFWNNDDLNNLDWMPESNHVECTFTDKWDSFVEHFGHLVDKEGLALGEKLAPNIDWVINEIACRPKTITHSDLREDNLLFGPDGTEDEVIIVDWQLATRSMGVFDVTRLMAGSSTPDERRGHEIEILRAWHNTLKAEGIDYYWEEALYDLRLAMLQCICHPVHFHTAFIDKQKGRSKLLTEAIVRRHFASAVDLQAEVALPG